MTADQPENLVAVAEIISPQGRHGQVKAMPMTFSTDRYADLHQVTACIGDATMPLTLTGWRVRGQFVYLDFAEVMGIGEAETLRGALVCIPASERAVLPEGSYYHDDLTGLSVQSTTGECLGRVQSVLVTGANDVFVVKNADGQESLIPALRSVVRRVDLTARTMVVDYMVNEDAD